MLGIARATSRRPSDPGETENPSRGGRFGPPTPAPEAEAGTRCDK
jgi:hypothetical protein